MLRSLGALRYWPLNRKVRLQNLPRNNFEFAALELAEQIDNALNRSRKYYDTFKWENNLKQLAFKMFLKNPLTDRIQHFGLRGSVGSGKSTTAIAWFYELMDAFPGIQILVMRRTHAEMTGSIYRQIELFNQTYGIEAHYRASSQTAPAQIVYRNGSKWVFRSAESAMGGNRKGDTAIGLGSTEYSGALLEEANAIPLEVVDTIPNRLREPSGVPVRLIAYIFNPTTTSHWAYKRFSLKVDPASGQPLSSPEDYNELKFTMEDNRKNLPPGFIESQYEHFRNKPSLFQRMIMGEYGPEIKGSPIYGPYFNRSTHLSQESFIHNWVKRRHWDDGPVCVNFDFGYRHPCITVFQDVEVGQFRQIRILAGWLGDNITLRPFASFYMDEIKKMFPNATIECYGDPAGKNKDPRGVTEEDAFDVLKSLGLNPKSCKTHEDAGVDLVIALLKTLESHKILGLQPAIVVENDLTYTKDIIDMLEIGFAQDPDAKSGQLCPVDDDYYIHFADSLRYGITNRRSIRNMRSPGSMRDRERGGDYKVLRTVEDGRYNAEPMSLQEFLDAEMGIY